MRRLTGNPSPFGAGGIGSTRLRPRRCRPQSTTFGSPAAPPEKHHHRARDRSQSNRCCPASRGYAGVSACLTAMSTTELLAAGEKVKPKLMINVAARRRGNAMAPAGERDTSAQATMLEGHDALLGHDQRGGTPSRNPSKPGISRTACTSPPRRADRQLLHRVVIEERLPDLEAEKEKEIRYQDVRQQPPIVAEELTQEDASLLKFRILNHLKDSPFVFSVLNREVAKLDARV